MIAGGKLIKKASYATIRKRNTMFFGHIMRRYALGEHCDNWKYQWQWVEAD